jgi:hypothetical protein
LDNEYLPQASDPQSPTPGTRTRTPRTKINQQGCKVELLVPLQYEANHQDTQDLEVYLTSRRSATKMTRRRDDTNINGWMRALTKEVKTIIDNETLNIQSPPDDGEPITPPFF